MGSARAASARLARDSLYKEAADYDHAFEEVRQTLGSDEDGRRSEFLSLIKTAKKLTAASEVNQSEQELESDLR